ncbi:phosphoglycerate kinase [Candidatus Tachikawaea gelatinosa]|uniref:Phosphoglycerate kinase n=1 Tax=Candidatus Tachikawaea gelatinosa TaxID=1410383 RepID=A0A090AQQ4_9ENTR|nr:phosphoglycerate kinase [Candidatus Tachikawaea gelatinosa]BAP58677.1 phosphoglycerate kinase [Candidatus Tachikawaea gelatinosa]
MKNLKFLKKINDLDIVNKRVLIRVDFNVPIKNKKIISYQRINAALSTIEYALKKKAKVILLSHLGRPTEGQYNKDFSLHLIMQYLEKKIQGIKINLIRDYLNGINFNKNEIILLENARFNKGELENNDNLAKKYANLCDIFVMDAFGVAHRAQASTHGVIKFSKQSCIGFLLHKEITMLNQIMIKPLRPLVSIVGGSKISTKFKILESLGRLSDAIIVGGGIANTFIAIENKVGKSLYEPAFVKQANNLKEKYNICIPIDVRVSKTFEEESLAIIKKNHLINSDEEIMDCGEESIKKIKNLLKTAKTILWNGPIGVFEFKNFRQGTRELAKAIAESNSFSVAGGGDTLAAIELFNIQDKISYISTGGGAFLKFIEGKSLPSLSILQEKNKM